MSMITFNLGLENNPYNANQCVELLDGFGELIDCGVVMGEYEGKPERTLVAVFDSVFFPEEDLVSEVRCLARKTTQDCIAFTVDYYQDGNVRGYVLGKMKEDDIKFDSQYFKTL